MHYTVIWLPAAENDLARIWMQAPDREAVTRAAHLLDQLLRESPEAQAHPEGDHYRLAVGPLVVLFRVLPDDCQVHVLAANSTEEF
jgi:plasmid stabilization system protein ParE